MDYYCFLLGDPNPRSTDTESLEEILGEIETADRGGFLGCFLAEHHNDRHQSLMSRPALTIAAALERATHLRFGTMVTILGIHHPYFVAEEMATLDVLSGGRIEYGFGGGGPVWWRQVGMNQKEAGARLDEGIALVQELLRGEEMSYEGTYWSGTGARVVPTVVQRPHPPMWLTGHSDVTIDRAARLRVSFCTGFVSCETVRARRDRYRQAWVAHHGDSEPGRVAHMVLAAVGDNRKEVERVALPAMRTKLYEFAKATLGKRNDPTFTFDRALRERFDVETWEDLLSSGVLVYGTVDDCIEQFGAISQGAGEALLVQARFGDLDRGFSRDSTARLALDVLPKVGGRSLDPAVADGGLVTAR